jgi:hypothetical protein
MHPFFAQKKMHIQKDMTELKDELLMFPRGKHDDLLDGLYYATKHNYPPNHEMHKSNNHHIQGKFTKKSDDWLIT